jgi:hypothetical protein
LVSLRKRYIPKKSLYNQFLGWAEWGVWDGVFSEVAGGAGALYRLFIPNSCVEPDRCTGAAKGVLAKGIIDS